MKHRRALVSEEELDKVREASKKASETHEQTLHRQGQNQTHNYDKHKCLHLVCAKGSALLNQCCSFLEVTVDFSVGWVRG